MSSDEDVRAQDSGLVVEGKPYSQQVLGSTILREFSGDVDPDDLEWHQDERDRQVRVIEGNGWLLQFDAALPSELVDGRTYYVPAKTWHRVIRGEGRLVVEIVES